MKSDSRYLLVIVVALVVLPGMFAFPIEDDFSLSLVFQRDGILDGIWSIYRGWTGRLVGTFLWSLFLTNINFLPFGSILFGLSFVALCYKVNQLQPFNMDLNRNFIIVLILFWFSLNPFLAESVFWVTGGAVYVFPILLNIVWISIVYFKDIESRFKKILFFLFSVVSGLCHEQLIPIVTTFFVISLIPSSHLSFVKLRNQKNYVYFFGYFIGAVVLVFAPGNFIRAAQNGSSVKLDFLFIASNIIDVIIRVLGASWKKMMIGLAFGMIQVIFVGRQKDSINKKISISQFIFLILSGATLSVTPFFILSSPLAMRSLFIPVLILVFGSFVVPLYFSDQILRLHRFFKIKDHTYLQIICAAFLFFSISEIYNCFQFKKAMNVRIKVLEKTKGNEIVLDQIEVKFPKVLLFREVSTDKDSWVNKSIADFYGQKSVQLRQKELVND